VSPLESVLMSVNPDWLAVPTAVDLRTSPSKGGGSDNKAERVTPFRRFQIVLQSRSFLCEEQQKLLNRCKS
jgi:hypothetical protein